MNVPVVTSRYNYFNKDLLILLLSTSIISLICLQSINSFSHTCNAKKTFMVNLIKIMQCHPKMSLVFIFAIVLKCLSFFLSIIMAFYFRKVISEKINLI